MALPPHSLHNVLCRPCWQMLRPPQSLQMLFFLPCLQVPLPPQYLHWLRILACSQMPLPPQSTHRLWTLSCSQITCGIASTNLNAVANRDPRLYPLGFTGKVKPFCLQKSLLLSPAQQTRQLPFSLRCSVARCSRRSAVCRWCETDVCPCHYKFTQMC